MVNEKEAKFCERALHDLGFEVGTTGGGHWHHMRMVGERYRMLVNGLPDVDACGELVTNRHDSVIVGIDDTVRGMATHMTFFSLGEALDFFREFEIVPKKENAETAMVEHGFEWSSTGGGCDAFVKRIDDRNVLFLHSNTADGIDTYPQGTDEPVQLSLDVDDEQVCFWWFDDLTSALAFADVFVSKKGE